MSEYAKGRLLPPGQLRERLYRVWPTIKTSVIMMQSLDGLSLRIDAVRSRVPPRIRGTGPDGSAVRTLRLDPAFPDA